MFNTYPYGGYPQYGAQMSGLKGRPVSSIEEVRAAQVDFDGSLFIFPDIADKKIYTKQINLDGTAATASSVQMYVNGVALVGALTEATIITAGDVEPGSIAAVVPVGAQCCCSQGTAITFVISGTTATIQNINVIIIKMA